MTDTDLRLIEALAAALHDEGIDCDWNPVVAQDGKATIDCWPASHEDDARAIAARLTLHPAVPDSARPGLREGERFAANAILDRPSADPDDDAAIVARAALRAALDADTGSPDTGRDAGLDEAWLHENDIGCLYRDPTGTMVVKACDPIYHIPDAARIAVRLNESPASPECPAHGPNCPLRAFDHLPIATESPATPDAGDEG